MKQIRKRLMALLLSCFLAFSGVAGSYQTAQAAEIVAGYTIGQILESILLSFGISIFTTEMIQKGTSATWWDTDGSAALKPYYDDLEQAYEEQRFKVINGGGGQNPEPSPTPAPGATPIPFPTTVPVGDIPTFQELVAPALAGTAAFINMTQGAWECMGKAISQWWDEIVGMDESINNVKNPYAYKDLIGIHTITQNRVVNPGTSSEEKYTDIETGYIYDSDNMLDYMIAEKIKGYQGSYMLFSQPSTLSGNHVYTYVVGKWKSYESSNTHLSSMDSTPFETGSWSLDSYTENYSFYIPVHYGNEIWDPEVKPLSKEEIWVHPDLQDTYQNNGKLEYPQQAPQPLQIPSGDQLADLSKKLNPEINTEFSPEMAPSYIAELIQQLQKGLNPDPDPNPDPNPNPDPDPNPVISPTGAPDPEPTKAPEEDSSSDVDPKDYAIDLRKIFPFCIPFDLIHLLNVLDAEPEAPRFEIPIDLEADNPFNGKKIVDYHTKIVVDMSDYEQPIKVIRIFEVMFFILALLLITRDQMIKG